MAGTGRRRRMASRLHVTTSTVLFWRVFEVFWTAVLQNRTLRPEDVMKMTRTPALLVALGLSLTTMACAFEHATNMAGPTAAPAASAAATPVATGSTAAPLVGLWESNALPALPSPT